MSYNHPPLIFTNESHYPCDAKTLYDWHSRDGALERLLPPWEKTRIVSKTGSIAPGGRVILKMHNGPVPFTFHALHVEDVPGKMFCDIQEKGPFASWKHSHFFSDSPTGSTLNDYVEYRLPLQNILPGMFRSYVHKNLAQVFFHREKLLLEDIKLHMRCSTKPLRILISGASGVLGRELIPLLTTGGHEVFRLVRRAPEPDSNEIFWNPDEGILEVSKIPEIDGIIHLAGEYIGLSRWAEQRKQRVLDSRIKGTRLLARTAAKMSPRPSVFLSASAVGFYGNNPKLNISEDEPCGSDFISGVCRVWEEAAEPAREAGIRTVFLRLGVGLTPRGGALKKILSASRLGFVRRFGPGNQYISWISSDDMVSAMLHCFTCEELEGPVNIAAPNPVTNEEFMKTLARLTSRPLLFPVSEKLLHIVYGQMASEILLSGCHVSTSKLEKSGFVFRHPKLEFALYRLLGKDPYVQQRLNNLQ